MEVTIISYPLNEINETLDVENTYIASRVFRNLWIDVSQAPTDKYIEVSFNSVVKTLLITDECRYTPIDIAFQNKNGATEVITFFKARKPNLNVTKETFEGNRPIPQHQFVDFNVKGRHKFTASSGFVTEDKNDSITHLLMSERVWEIGDIAIPLNIKTSSLEYKTRQNDKLINYVIEFEHAYYENNTV